ncbi:NADPH-dependent FMN reductase [Mesorhizobium xinjiangense]|uniref:NADPH-dependent FMN reductase n=1 Tax=Mesorhizobium xinjiangense TaxID=2678685 RepID=UPI0012EEC3D2|nr:NADPH-dependent FMN reductase [Mesorhizobium xinjiangense]
MTTILCLSGSLRKDSSTSAFLKTLVDQMQDAAAFRFAEIGHLPHYNADLGIPGDVGAFKDAIERADGLLIVTPEYNYSVPGVLKNAIDWASRPAYLSVFKEKPVFIVTVSGGALGGVRAQAHLKYIMNGMLADVFVNQEVVVPHAPKKVENGRFTDMDVLDFARSAVSEFIAAIKVKDAA